MRHRLIPDFEAERITTNHVIAQVIKEVPKTVEAVAA